MSSYTEENSQVPEMQQNLALLKEIPFFSSFPAQALKLLAFLAEKELFLPGEVIFEKGDDNGQAYLLLSGKLLLLKTSDGGKAVVQEYHSGQFLGSFSLLGSMRSLFILQAEEKTSVLTINRTQFEKIVEQFPETGKLALKAALSELHQWERQNITDAEECCLNTMGVTVL